MLKQFTGCITYDMLDEVVDFEAMETEGMDLGGLMIEFTDPGYNTKRECKADIRAAYKHWSKVGIMKSNKLRFLSSQVAEVELYADDEDRMIVGERLHEEFELEITPNPNNYTAKEFEAVKSYNKEMEHEVLKMKDSFYNLININDELEVLDTEKAGTIKGLMKKVSKSLTELKAELSAI